MGVIGWAAAFLFFFVIEVGTMAQPTKRFAG